MFEGTMSPLRAGDSITGGFQKQRNARPRYTTHFACFAISMGFMAIPHSRGADTRPSYGDGSIVSPASGSASQPPATQASPSLEETMKWMAEKMTAAGTFEVELKDQQTSDRSVSKFVTSASANGRVLRVNWDYSVKILTALGDSVNAPAFQDLLSATYIIDMSNLDANTVEVKDGKGELGGFAVAVKTIGNRKLISSSSVSKVGPDSGGKSELALDQISLNIQDEATANRIANALKYAIRISGGQAEAPKKKEPF